MSSKSKRRPQPDPDETAYQAFQDQLAAATDDLERSTVLGYTLGHAAGYYTGDMNIYRRKADELPDWVHQGWRAAFEPWMEDRSQRCPHNPTIWRPQPVFAVAWRPGLVVCAECLPVTFAASVAEDRTCDSCGRVVGGPENGDPIYAISLSHDNMSFRAGACKNCYTPPEDP